MRKSLLTVALGTLAMSASAVVPVTFRDCCWNDIDGGGKMDYESVMDTDGSEYIRMTPTKKTLPNESVPAGARYFRTVDLGEALPADYTIFAFDYKISHKNDRLCFYFHEKQNEAEWVSPLMTVSDEWQTAYCAFTAVPDWWRDESVTNKRYHWVILDSWSESADADYTFCVKNLRYLTKAEAQTEAGSIQGDQADMLVASSDVTAETDDETGSTMFQLSDATGANPLMATAGRAVPVATDNTYFAFDYSSEENIAANVWLLQNNSLTGQVVTTLIPKTGDLLEDFSTFKVDLKSKIEAISFARAFGSGDYLWLQCPANPGAIFAVKNVRWTSEKVLSGINEISADEAANGEATYYNLQGQQVANPANGLYIKKQGNTTTKVLVK